MKTEISKTRAYEILWERGEIESLFFHSGQRTIDKVYRDAPGAVVVFNISRQWGKTFFGVTKAITLALKKKGAKIRVAAALETDLAEFVEPAFEVVLARCPHYLRPKYIQSKKRYVFKNGATIKLVGLDKKPNGLRGNSIDFIILDEAGFINRLNYLHTSVIVPLITHKPDAKILLLSTPPESPDHEFWDFVARAKLDGAYCEFSIDENPLLTPQDIARIEREMGGRHTTAFQREYLCKRIIETERALIPEFNAELHEKATARPAYFKFLHTYEGLDTGVRHKTVELLGYYDFPRSVVVVEDEIVLSGSEVTTRNIKLRTREKEQELGYTELYRRVADNNNLILIQDLGSDDSESGPGLYFMPTSKDSLEAMVNKVRLWFKDNRVEIHPRCKILLGTLTAGLWNKKRDDFAVSTVFGHCDALAALMYLIRNIDVSTNPIPDHFSHPADSAYWLRPAKKPQLSELGQDLAQLFKKKVSDLHEPQSIQRRVLCNAWQKRRVFGRASQQAFVLPQLLQERGAFRPLGAFAQ